MEQNSLQKKDYSESEIINKICIIRDHCVMPDKDLAEMYGVSTSQLNQAVNRNISGFPFTEQGVAMLSSVLRSERAIQVNIQIIRVYTKMKQLLLDNKDLWLKIEKIEQSLINKDEEVKSIFEVLKQLLQQKEKPRSEIGFLASKNNHSK